MGVAPTDNDTGATFRLIYRSRDVVPLRDRRVALGELFSTARSNNKKLHVTGALLVRDGCFVQTLEGEEQVVLALFARIEADPRHDDVELLDTGTVPDRVFVRWAMAKVAEDGESDIPLIAHSGGISHAASRGDETPEQEGVLKIMRDAARG